MKAEREKGRKNWRHHPFTTRSRVADSDRPELGQLTANWWMRKGGSVTITADSIFDNL